MSDKIMKQVDVEEPTPPLDLDKKERTQRECEPNLKIVQENKNPARISLFQ